MSKADKTVQSICDMIQEASVNDIRIGQLFSIVFDMLAQEANDPFFVEDAKLNTAMRTYLDS